MLAHPILALGATLLGVAQALPRNAELGQLIPRHNDWLPRKTCVVPSYNDPKQNDVPAIEKAFAECGNGGIIRFSRGTTYHINGLLRMKGCNHCVVEWDGLFLQSDDIDLIQASQVFFTFQNKSTSIIFEDAYRAHVYSPSGTGGIDGQGQTWWIKNANASDLDPGTLRRPMLITWLNCHHVYVDRLKLNASPNWNNLIANSTYMTIDNFNITARAVNSTIKPKNTDGFDTLNVTNIWVNNLYFDGGDDCIAWKGNNTDVGISNSVCIGSHGTSVGSLAQYAGIHDYVSGVKVKNVTFYGGNNALRIKVWPASPTHGSAYVEDVVFEDVVVEDIDTPIFVESCYESSVEECVAYPSKSTLQNIIFRRVKGSSSGAKGSVVADLRCPPSANCTVYLEDIDIVPGNGTTATYLCQGLAADPGVPCTDSDTADGGYVAGRLF